MNGGHGKGIVGWRHLLVGVGSALLATALAIELWLLARDHFDKLSVFVLHQTQCGQEVVGGDGAVVGKGRRGRYS